MAAVDFIQFVHYMHSCQRTSKSSLVQALPIRISEFLDRHKSEIGRHGRHTPNFCSLLGVLKGILFVGGILFLFSISGCRLEFDHLGAQSVVLVDFDAVVFQVSFCDFGNGDEFVGDLGFGGEGDERWFVVGGSGFEVGEQGSRAVGDAGRGNDIQTQDGVFVVQVRSIRRHG